MLNLSKGILISLLHTGKAVAFAFAIAFRLALFVQMMPYSQTG